MVNIKKWKMENKHKTFSDENMCFCSTRVKQDQQDSRRTVVVLPGPPFGQEFEKTWKLNSLKTCTTSNPRHELKIPLRCFSNPGICCSFNLFFLWFFWVFLCFPSFFCDFDWFSLDFLLIFFCFLLIFFEFLIFPTEFYWCFWFVCFGLFF